MLKLIFVVFSIDGMLSNDPEIVNLIKDSSLITKLPSWFDGTNLTYTIDCPSTAVENYNLSTDVSKQRSRFVPLNESLGNVNLQSIQMSTRWFDQYALAFYFNETFVTCIKLNTSSYEMNIFWELSIRNFSVDGFISGVQPIIIEENKELLFVAINSQSGNSYHTIDYEYWPYLERTEVNLRALDRIESMRLHLNIRSNFVAISGLYQNVCSLFIVDCTNSKNPSVQNISVLYSVANYSSLAIQPISVLILQSSEETCMLVLDRSNYLIRYNYSNNSFVEVISLSLLLYNQPNIIYPYSYNGEFQNQVFVYTYDGVLIVELFKMSEILFINTTSINNVFGIFESNNFLYMLTEINSKPGIAIAHLDFPKSILYINELNCSECNIHTPWAYFQGNGKPVLLKINQNNLSSITFISKIPTVEFNTYDISNFTCIINATGNEPQEKNISVYMYDISFNDIREFFYKDAKNKIVEFYLHENVSEFSLPTDFVSGWNKTCLVQNSSFDVDNQTNLVISNNYINNNFKTFMSIDLGTESINVLFLDIFIINIKISEVELIDINSKNKSIINISNVSEVRKVSISKDLNALVFLFNFTSVYFYPYPLGTEGIFYFDFFQNITLFDSVSNYLILSNSSILQIFTYNSETMKYEFLFNRIISDEYAIMDLKAISRGNKYLANLMYLQFKLPSNQTRMTVFNLNSISVYSFPYFINQIQIPDFISFNVTSSNCYFFYIDKIMVYDYLLNIKVAEFYISVTNTLILNNTIAGYYKTQITIFNSSEASLDKAVIFSFNDVGTLVGFNYFLGTEINPVEGSLIGIVKDKQIILYFLGFLNPYISSVPSAQFQVDFSSGFHSKNYKFSGKMYVNCSNHITSLGLTFDVAFYTYGMKIFVDQSKYIVKDIDYTTEVAFPLTHYVLGSDLQVILEINGKRVNEDDKNVPLNYEHSVNAYTKITTKQEILSMTLVPNSANVIISTKNGQILSYDITTQLNLQSFSVKGIQQSSCRIIRTVARTNEYVLLALICSPNDSLFKKTSVVLISIYLKDFNSKLFYHIQETEYDINYLRVVNASNKKFVLILVESTNRSNNHIQVMFCSWNKTSIMISSSSTLNFYELGIKRFLCEGADGYYSYTGYFELYVVDKYYGLRVLNYTDGQFIQVFKHQISQPVMSIGLCRTVLLVGCLDTSVIVFSKQNKQFKYMLLINPYNNASSNYTSKSGYLECNDYYHPTFFALPIENNDKYVIRIMNARIDSPSAVLRDILISNSRPTNLNYSNVIFYNSSLFFVADTVKGDIYGYSFASPYIYFPKFSLSEFRKIEADWGRSPYRYSLSITSGSIFYKTQNYSVNRGIAELPESSDSSGMPLWMIFVISTASLLGLIVIAGIIYRCRLKQQRKLHQIELEKYKLSSSVLYASTLKRFVVNGSIQNC